MASRGRRRVVIRLVPPAASVIRTPVRRSGDRKAGRVRVLGVDPGLTRCGLGVVEGAPGRALSLIGVDVVRTAADIAGRRCGCAHPGELEHWLDMHGPTRSRSSGSSPSTTSRP